MRLIDQRLLLSAALLLALALAHIGTVTQELVPANGQSGSIAGFIDRVTRCSHARLALILIGLAGLECSLIGASMGQRLADLIVVPAYFVGAVATWWLCIASVEHLRLAAVAVAIIGVWLLG